VPPGQTWYNGLLSASSAAAPTAAPPSASAASNSPPLEITPQLPEPLVADELQVGKSGAASIERSGAPDRAGDHLESHLLGAALKKLRRQSDPRGALDLFDQYDKKFPHGRMAPESLLGRVEALMALGKRSDALAILDGPLAEWRMSRSIRVLRGELR